eukprot:TRINITY_DN1209_c0_g1_i1.p1 TRINITY_DN1209_c0_g1~~TRINITY_DN1209_c0_g1_i1.p1  ORF type:complete len:1016 (-),score=414.02 TRINITY_DN1209_c0_g1_i1:154-3201(-)
MDHPSEAVSGEGNADGIEQQNETSDSTVTGNGKEEELSLNETEDTVYVASTKRKVLNLAPPEEVPKNFADYLSDSEADESIVKAPIPTSVIQSAPPKPENPALEEASVETPPVVLNTTNLEESVPGPVQDAVAGGPGEQSATPPTDAISAETEQEESQIAQPEQILNLQPPSEELPAELLDTEQQEEKEEEQAFTVADLIEEEENTKEEESVAKEAVPEKETTKSVETAEEVNESESESPMEVEAAVAQNPKAKKSQAVKAAELEQDWDEEGGENPPDETVEKSKSTPKPTASKSVPKDKMEPEFTPKRSSRAPKPTQKKLESENQKNLNTEDMEESVDAIAKELEKSDSEIKKSGKKEKSPKKGKKQQQDGENKEDWVALIFGENGEKVTEKGTPKSKQAKPEENKTEEMGPEAEEFLVDQTPFFSSKNKGAKKGGRPRKKDLDEKMDGVAKLGTNEYFYTGPGGAESPPSLHSDDEDLPVNAKKQDSEPARKSGRAGKGRNPRLEREDEVVDIPQVKAPPKPNLNPSWLKNHDGKSASTPVASKSKPVTSTPAPPKAVSTPAATPKAVTSPAPVKAATPAATKAAKPAAATPVAAEVVTPPARGRSAIKGSDRGTRASTDSQDKTESEASPPRDEALPEFDPAKFTPGYVPKTVEKGGDEYMIVVSGVKDTGLCGGYWGNTETLGNRRRSKPPEALQLGKTEKTASRRGSVGSVGSSVDTTPTVKKTPQAKKVVTATPQTKSTKKQVTKPEKRVESMDSSQSESEVDTEQNTSKGGRGRKRKNEETPPASQEKKARTTKKEQAAKEEDEEDIKASFSDYDSGANETQPLRTTKRPSAKTAPDSPTKDAPLTSKQQTAVSQALAAGVPAGQQRSVSCVADTNTQREVVVECFAPYDDHRWVNIGKERDGMAPDAVQYARALRPPYHLLSFLRIKGHSTKGMSCTDKNTMVFVVLEGEITVILHTTQFNAKKGDSFYIPPKNYYNLINQKAREAELSLIQFQYDGPLPTVQPNSG